MTTPPIRATRDAVKRLSVYKQGLHQRPAASDQAALKRIIERIGLLQLDSISVVARSHYLVMLARAGLYDPAELDALLDEGFLFETWAHAMCQLPTAHYPWYHAYIRRSSSTRASGSWIAWGSTWRPSSSACWRRFASAAPLSSKDFESERQRRRRLVELEADQGGAGIPASTAAN